MRVLIVIVSATMLLLSSLITVPEKLPLSLRTNFSISQTTVTLPGNSGPLDTGVIVGVGDIIRITATGQIFNGLVTVAPDGLPERPSFGVPPLPSISSNSLIGSIGSFGQGMLLSDGADINAQGVSGTSVGFPGLFGPGYIGSSFSCVAATSGHIYIVLNDDPLSDNSGNFSVTIKVIPASALIHKTYLPLTRH